MSELQPVTLSFEGEEYTVDSQDSIWGLIEAIEDVVTLMWLAPRLDQKQFPAVKIYRAYAAALRYAGAKGVTPEQVQQGVTHERLVQMAYELAAILMMAMPPVDVELGEQTTPSEHAKKKPKKAKAKSSGRASKSG